MTDEMNLTKHQALWVSFAQCDWSLGWTSMAELHITDKRLKHPKEVDKEPKLKHRLKSSNKATFLFFFLYPNRWIILDNTLDSTHYCTLCRFHKSLQTKGFSLLIVTNKTNKSYWHGYNSNIKSTHTTCFCTFKVQKVNGETSGS